MPTQDQLEIISPDGRIEFHVLEPGKGVTNIGRHPDNDLVLDSPEIASFQAVLDHQQKPYRIMTLTAEGEVSLGGERLAPNHFHEVQDWDTLKFDGFVLVLLEADVDQALSERRRVTMQPAAPPSPAALAEPVEPEAPAAPSVAAQFSLRPPDLPDDVIIVEMPEREWITDVDQALSFPVTVINGGSLVASFDIQLEGLDESWVSVAPPKLNLNEGARATVTVYIQAPRLPTSRAGLHHLSVVVTSPNYPERSSRLGGTLTINPFYEYAVGDLSPKQQTISWRKRTGEVTLPVTNRGNSEEAFRLSAEDDERGCQFEFDLPGEGARLVRQAEFRLEPAESRAVPVCVTPMRRRLVAFRKHTYAFTITTTQVEGLPSPRMVMGQVNSRPLIGPLLLFLILAGLVALVAYMVKPVSTPLLSLTADGVDPGAAGMSQLPETFPSPAAIRVKGDLRPLRASTMGGALLQEQQNPTDALDSVTLYYNASRFQGLSEANLLNRLNSLFLELRLDYRPDVEGSEWRTVKTPVEFEGFVGKTSDAPPQTGYYRLRADTWLSQLLPVLAGASAEKKVVVAEVKPQIEVFRVDPATSLQGEEVTLSWRVTDAEALKLAYDGVEETLQNTDLESGTRKFTVEKDTTFTLTASNRWGETTKPLEVKVTVLAPVIVRFDVDPLEIMEGETVRITWEVEGADRVSISPLGEDLPLQGDVGNKPPQDPTQYTLTAIKQAPDGSEVTSIAVQEVRVSPLPTGTPEPQPPVVQVFEVTPKEVVQGDNELVTLTWSVSGQTTNIEITGPGGLKVTGLDRAGSTEVVVNDTALFVCTAYNGDLSHSLAQQVVAAEPTPLPTDTPVPTPTPLPPIIDDFWPTADPLYGGAPTYMVYINAEVVLHWKVVGENVRVFLSGTGIDPSPSEVSRESQRTVKITENSTFQLRAENPGGTDIRDFEITVLGTEPPDPPYEFWYDSTLNQFTWRYAEPTKIVGFNIYDGGPSPLWSWDVLPSPDSEQPYRWSLGTECGGTYYLVAVYEDPPESGDYSETDAAVDSWGVPCSP